MIERAIASDGSYWHEVSLIEGKWVALCESTAFMLLLVPGSPMEHLLCCQKCVSVWARRPWGLKHEP